MTTALILTGGGSLGVVQAGMLRELMASGPQPDLIVGVSPGALNGAFLAKDPCVTAVDRMVALWSHVTDSRDTRNFAAFAAGVCRPARSRRRIARTSRAASERASLPSVRATADSLARGPYGPGVG